MYVKGWPVAVGQTGLGQQPLQSWFKSVKPVGKPRQREQPELRKQSKGLHAQTSAVLIAVMSLVSSTAAVATDFSDIDPILRARCVICHAGPAAPLGLSLDSRDGLLAGSSRGAIVAAGDPGGSELIKRLKGTSLPRMPMTGPPYLTDEEVALFEQWILDGMRTGAVSEPSVSTPSPETAAGPVRYDQVAPIFATRCVKCHTEKGLMGGPPEGYRLASYADTVSTSDRVRVVPGNPGASELVRRIRGQALPRMPFDGPPFLTDDEIALIEQWIADGAMDSAGSPAPIPVGSRVRLDKSPRPGDYVEVRGTLDADGRVVVDRMRPRD